MNILSKTSISCFLFKINNVVSSISILVRHFFLHTLLNMWPFFMFLCEKRKLYCSPQWENENVALCSLTDAPAPQAETMCLLTCKNMLLKKKNPISKCCLSDLLSFSWLPVSAPLIQPLFSGSSVYLRAFPLPPSTARATRDWSAGDLIKAPVGGRFWKICSRRNQHIFEEISAIRSTNNRWQGRQMGAGGD